MKTHFFVTPDEGGIELLGFRAQWSNQETVFGADYSGWAVLGFREFNLEFGQIDQDRPGIYLTRYLDGEVDRLKTLLEL